MCSEHLTTKGDVLMALNYLNRKKINDGGFYFLSFQLCNLVNLVAHCQGLDELDCATVMLACSIWNFSTQNIVGGENILHKVF